MIEVLDLLLLLTFQRAELCEEPGESGVTEVGETEAMGEVEMLTISPTETRTGFLFFTTRETSKIQETVEKTKTCSPTMRARPPGLAWVADPKVRGDMFTYHAINGPDMYNLWLG